MKLISKPADYKSETRETIQRMNPSSFYCYLKQLFRHSFLWIVRNFCWLIKFCNIRKHQVETYITSHLSFYFHETKPVDRVLCSALLRWPEKSSHGTYKVQTEQSLHIKQQSALYVTPPIIERISVRTDSDRNEMLTSQVPLNYLAVKDKK